jgi:GT2 family glycosyltransferase
MLAQALRGFDSRYDKVQDYEFMLRVAEVTDRIRHIPKILYHWRQVPGSVALGESEKGNIGQLQVAAVNAHLARCGVPAKAEKHPRYNHRVVIVPEARDAVDRVSIVIPSKDAPDYIERCLESVFNATTYKNLEILVVDNGTTDERAKRVLKRYPVKVIPYKERFNYSRANNLGVGQATGRYIVLLNNDTEVVTPNWLELMVSLLEMPGVGAVGPLLLYHDGRVQHAGVVLGLRGTADHVMRGFPSDSDGYAGSLSCTREVMAVTGACLMTTRSLYVEVGGLCEYYGTHYQDVDFCLKLLDRGMRILFTPRAVLYHHESATRRQFYDHVDRALLLDTWGEVIEKGDRFYNRNFSYDRHDYALPNDFIRQ